MAVASPALAALGSLEVVERVSSYLNFFEYAGQLAISSWTTWNALRLHLLEHAHNVRQFRERMASSIYLEAHLHLRRRDLARDFSAPPSTDSDDS